MSNRQSRKSRAHGARLFSLILVVVTAQLFAASSLMAAPAGEPEGQKILLAEAEESEESEDRPASRPLEPRYQPREPVEESWYNGSYIFGMTRGVANSTIAPAGKAPLFLFTVPLDIVLLPFTVIGGLFG